jgi:hypothetical protein
MELPSLVHDFSDARIDAVVIGPRRELTLSITPLVWDGPNGRCGEPVRVRSELAWLRYAEGRRSKPGCLFFELVFERVDARLVIQCSSLQMSSPAG